MHSKLWPARTWVSFAIVQKALLRANLGQLILWGILWGKGEHQC